MLHNYHGRLHFLELRYFEIFWVIKSQLISHTKHTSHIASKSVFSCIAKHTAGKGPLECGVHCGLIVLF